MSPMLATAQFIYTYFTMDKFWATYGKSGHRWPLYTNHSIHRLRATVDHLGDPSNQVLWSLQGHLRLSESTETTSATTVCMSHIRHYAVTLTKKCFLQTACPKC